MRTLQAVCSLPAERFHAADAQRGFGGSIKDAELLAESTSGGAFTAIATAFLENDGFVFGVESSEVYKARHASVSSVEGLVAFRGSKYVQSEIGDAYSRVHDLLKMGNRVLFRAHRAKSMVSTAVWVGSRIHLCCLRWRLFAREYRHRDLSRSSSPTSRINGSRGNLSSQ